MELKHTVFRNLFLWMFSRSRPWGDLAPKAKSIYDEILPTYRTFANDAELENALPADGRLQVRFASFLYLEPSVKNNQVMLPVVTLRCNFDPNQRSVDEVRIRVGLFFRHQEHVRSIGFRFESPEGEGIHNYYHVQPIRKLGTEPLMPGGSDWFPEWDPSLPLDAHDPVTLVLSILMGLYGRDYIDSQLQTANFAHELQQFRNAMKYQIFQPTYWEVHFPKGVQYWKTFDEKRFKSIMRTAHRATNFKKVNQREYYAPANDNKRSCF